MEQLKNARSVAKGNVTRKANKVNELLASGTSESVKIVANELNEAANLFQNAHEAFHQSLKDEQELKESTLYYNSVDELVSELNTKIKSWLEKPVNSFQTGDQKQVQPEDSVSSAGSKISSVKSSASAKARAAAKQAALKARAKAMQKLHELQLKELKIQQMKSQVELQGELAAMEAEQNVYEQLEAEEKTADKTVSAEAKSKSISTPLTSQAQVVQDGLQPPNEPLSGLSNLMQPLNPTAVEWHPHSSSLSNQRQDDSIKHVMEMQNRQNSALQQLVQQQQTSVMALTLPQSTIKAFNGNPIEYSDFIRSFEHLVESKTSDASARLYYLTQHTSGPAQELMKSFLSMEPTKGYEEARKALRKRYGQDYRVAAAHIKLLTDGPPIKSEDGNLLEQLSIQLISCTNTLKEIGSLRKLDHPENLKRIVDRLPYGMRLKWRDAVDQIVEREGRDVTIEDVTKFVSAKARASSHPVFKQDNGRVRKPIGPKGSGFAIQTRQGDTRKNACPCNENHLLSRCDKFRKLTLEQRNTFVRESKLCINCLMPGHFVRSCPKQSFCKVDGCTSKHSTFLHPKQPRADQEKIKTHDKEPPVKPPPNEKLNDYSASGNNVNGFVKPSCKFEKPTSTSVTGLAIIPVRAKAKGQAKCIETYAFLDSGSNTSFCTERLLKEMNHQGCKTQLALTTIAGEGTPVECTINEFEITDLSGQNPVKLSNVYSTKILPIRQECIGKQEDVERWPHLNGITIPHIDAEIGLLIGSDVPEVLQPLEVRASQNGGPFATRTLMGWVLNGPLGRDGRNTPTSNFVQVDNQLNERFEQFCNMEFNDVSYEAQVSMSQNDKRALGVMEESAKLVNGHYEIGLPWRNYPPHLSDNLSQAHQRLHPLKKRLQRDALLHEKYNTFMNDLLKNDYAREVESEDFGPLGTHWYLPHHPVFHPQKPNKVRVVFDCSAKHHGTSLNDQLLQGPDLTNTLVGVLTRFREEPVAFIADIESMFYQVRVPPSDCDALRFLWWPNGDLSQEPKEYEMRVHLFGGKSSPSCANFALKKTGKDNKDNFSPEVINTLERNFYVDDCLKSVDNEIKAVNLAHDLRNLLSKGGFNLTKWVSNSRKVVESLPQSERASVVKNLDFNNWSVERALGVQWNITSDQFGFKIVIKDRPATRRGILSVVSSIYDPLGFIAPFILQAKLILQELCRLKLDWDDKIPEELLKRWQLWLEELPKLEKLSVDRCFKPSNLGDVESVQLHHFSDASQDGYGAATYLRIEDKQANVRVSFVMGKSRLSPIKPVTIPRLELSSAVVSTKLDKICRQEITLPVNESFFWTDSTCVLRYVENQNKRFQTFVANRIATILSLSSASQWRYVNTELNPADDASRGVSPDALQRWINGPEFLSESAVSWPKRPATLSTTIDDKDPEVKKPITCATASSEASTEEPLRRIMDRYSSWNRFKRIVAWILRYKALLQRQSKRRTNGDPVSFSSTNQVSPLAVNELQHAEEEIIKHIQRDNFSEECKVLGKIGKDSTVRVEKALKKASKIFKLDPVMIEGVIRVGGRLGRATIDDDAKHPMILPKRHPAVTLIIRHYHHISGHSGLEYTLSLIRQRYWIIDARRTVKGIIHRCISCRKKQAPVMQQKMADLPKDRVTPSKPPFSYTGVDCFGPFEVRRGRITVKRYGVLFTCLNIRAIHLEIVNSLDTGSFINALRRFISRRGQPEEIRSDNGGNFVKGEKDLRKAVQEWNQTQIHEFLVQRSIRWKFNPPTGSHHGGVWERCIRTTRKVLKALMKEQIMDEEGFTTLMCEVEAIVNGRPITKLSDDPRDMEPLTPNHLLLLKPGPQLPPAVLGKSDLYNRRWRQVQYLADVFWRRWVKEYLPSLQPRSKWNKKQRNVAVNDVVLVLDEKTPRNSWPLGRVIEVYSNRHDGLVRSVKLKTKTTELIRPVNKIVLLEAADTTNDK